MDQSSSKSTTNGAVFGNDLEALNFSDFSPGAPHFACQHFDVLQPTFLMQISTCAFLPLTLLAMSQVVTAAEPPGAGSQILQLPSAPTLQQAPPVIRIAPAAPGTVQGVDNSRILVSRLSFTGASVFSEAALVAFTGFVPNTELSLTQLRDMAERIASAYHQNGYLLAQAFLPAQDIKQGVVTITVREGQYGKIIINNSSNLSNRVVSRSLQNLHDGDAVRAAPLESDLLLLSDIPGVNIKSTLAPGAQPGSADLIVDVAPANRFSGSVDADNAGNRYTGANRIGATVNLNDPFGQGDLASLRVLSSGSGLNYARAMYQVPVGKARIGLAYSALHYHLGEEFAPLRANGSAQIASVYANYPLIRTRDTNLYVQAGFDAKTFQDRIDSTDSVTDKRSHVALATLYGDHRDAVGGAGVTSASLTLSSGTLNIDTPVVRDIDALTAQTSGHFSKLAFTLARLQAISESVSLYAALSGQVASKNLDVSEKIELGGVNGVRAYPEGETFADQGYLVNLEARYQLPKLSPGFDGQIQLIGFADTGSVTINKSPWADGVNHRTLSAAGVGVNFYKVNNYTVKAYYARKLGNATAVSAPDRSGRFWLQGVKYF